jgi:hypothetical protein
VDQRSAPCREIYLTTGNTHKKQISMPPTGFGHTIPTIEQPQSHALDGEATGIDNFIAYFKRLVFVGEAVTKSWS